ncbi:MAG: DUF222 domain-containing protein [Acidimicrobiia bacterium]
MRLSELRSAMKRYATRFDPALVSPRDAERVVEDAAAIEKMAATVKSLAAARVAETELWKRSGERSAAHDLAHKTGTSVGQAKEALETGRRLQDLPATAEAARRGQLSPQQASAIADAAGADPDAEQALLDTARSGSLRDLRDQCARTKANACDSEARRRRIHEQRCLRTWNDADGAGHLHLSDNPEAVAEIMARVTPIRDELAAKARAHGRPERLEAHAADALRHVACGIATAKSKPAAKILARVDLSALLRGYPVGDETCELAGYGPVAVSALRDLVDTGDPFLAAIVTKGTDIVGVAHLGRRPTAHQRSALEWLYPTCAASGCNNLTFLEFDHRDDWSKTHRTVFDLLDRLCRHHHDRKTRDGWALVEGRGTRAFVPPEDPRHPRHRGRPVANAPPTAA